MTCKKDLELIYDLKIIKIEWPCDNINIFNGCYKLKPFIGVHYNIMDVIADYLLYTNAKEFFKHSRQLTLNDNLTRIIGDFASSECHRMVDELLKDKKGPNASGICIGITMDDTSINITRSRNECPVLLYIYNCSGLSFKMVLLGFAPTNLPESDEVIDNYFLIQGQIGISKRKQYVNKIKRYAFLKFLSTILQPIKHYQDIGFKVQIGNDDNKIYVDMAYPILCAITGDNKQLDYIA